MSDRIELRGLRVHAFHGVLEQERITRQRFVIDLDLEVDLASAADSDRLEDTIDYSELAADVSELVKGERRNLIESVASRIADHVLTDPRVMSVRVTVHKPEAPMPFDFDDVAVTLFRSR